MSKPHKSAFLVFLAILGLKAISAQNEEERSKSAVPGSGLLVNHPACQSDILALSKRYFSSLDQSSKFIQFYFQLWIDQR